MNLLRRLFGRSPDDMGRDKSFRRAAHVTRSSSAPPMPVPSVAEAESQHVADEVDEVEQLPPQQPSSESDAIGDAESDADKEAQGQPQDKPGITQRRSRAQPAAPRREPEREYKPKRALSYGIASDVGKLRGNNEDACFAMQWHTMTVENRPDFGFFVVADGMGGHLDGERAAGIAVQTLASEMLQSVYMPLLRNFRADKTMILEALVAATEKANLAVIDAVPGGGTTLSTVAIVGNLAYLAHVGDSRAYLVHHDEIEQLTTDHTLVQRLIEMKELTPEEAEYYPQKNVLYRAIGQNESLKVERLIRTLPAAAHMIICSDGLWDQVDDETLKRVTLESTSPQAACDRLVSLANDHGGADNISVIILKVPGDDVNI